MSATPTAIAPTWSRAKARRSPLEPVGAGLTAKRRPEEEWIPVSVPQIVERGTFDLVQEKLSHNRRFSPRNNKSHRSFAVIVAWGVAGYALLMWNLRRRQSLA